MAAYLPDCGRPATVSLAMQLAWIGTHLRLFRYLESSRRKDFRALSIGKVAHVPNDFADFWSEPPRNLSAQRRVQQRMGYRDYQLREHVQAIEEGGLGPAFESAQVSDDAYFDGQIADQAVRTLAEFKEQKEPFFLAVGLLKAHLPFNAPERLLAPLSRE